MGGQEVPWSHFPKSYLSVPYSYCEGQRENQIDQEEARCVERTFLIHLLQLLLLLLVPISSHSCQLFETLSRTLLNGTSGPPLSTLYMSIF